jgi:hypothetical protein
MFLPSDDAIRHLCGALHALRAPQKLLEDHGLIEPGTYVDYDENDVPRPKKPSWEELKSELDRARNEKSEQLRGLCSELLRRGNDEDWGWEHPLDNCPSARFRDPLAQFLRQLADDRYRFDGFEIQGTPVESIVQRADEALSNALQSGEFPQCEKVREHRSAAVRLLSEDRYDESLTQLRSALQHCLAAIAGELAKQRGEVPPSFNQEWEVRGYLQKMEFFSREDRKGFDGIYGLLSSGAHGKGDKNRALLGYAACIMACHYAITRFRDFQSNKFQGTE